MQNKEGKTKTQTCPAWKIPGAPEKYRSRGIGNAAKWKAAYRGIRGSTLLHDAQTEPKYKLYSGATWTRTSWKDSKQTGREVDCRLCRDARETKEHLTQCRVIGPVWNVFYTIIDEAREAMKPELEAVVVEIMQDRVLDGEQSRYPHPLGQEGECDCECDSVCPAVCIACACAVTGKNSFRGSCINSDDDDQSRRRGRSAGRKTLDPKFGEEVWLRACPRTH